MKSEQQYIELFQEAGDMIRQKSCETMNAVRDDAFAVFKAKGFPSKKVERYKYTDVDAAFAPNYGITLNPLTIKPSPYLFNLKDAPKEVADYYNKIADGDDSITALNTALVHETLVVYVPRNQRPDEPIQVDYTLRGKQDMMMNRRVLVVLEEGAEATVIFNDHVEDFQRFLTTQVMEVVCKDNSKVDIYEVEETHALCKRFSNIYIHEGRDCSVKHNSITLFNGQTRNLCDVYMQGENSEVTLNGCAIAGKNQRIDNNTLIVHKVPNCHSEELYKYVVDDNSVGAFAGKILVEKDAQKTTSKETNANLCASNEARMFTQPMLEIYADDVRCAHGSTVGVMDETALFYMRQRGIKEEEARMLLKNAFMGQVIDQIQLRPLRDKLYVKVEKRFRGELDKCTGCRLCK